MDQRTLRQTFLIFGKASIVDGDQKWMSAKLYKMGKSLLRQTAKAFVVGATSSIATATSGALLSSLDESK